MYSLSRLSKMGIVIPGRNGSMKTCSWFPSGMRKPKQVICRKKGEEIITSPLLDLNSSCKPLGQPDSVIDNLQNGCPNNLKERINAIVTESRKPLQVERWARRPGGKRSMRCQIEKKDPTQALTRTLWENWIIILQIYVTMKIISDPYPWTSRKTFLHQSSHWARFPKLCSKQSKHLPAQIIYHSGFGRITLPYWQYLQHKQSGTYPCQLKGRPVHGSELMSIRYPK